jgi:hypothetical protein
MIDRKILLRIIYIFLPILWNIIVKKFIFFYSLEIKITLIISLILLELFSLASSRKFNED